MIHKKVVQVLIILLGPIIIWFPYFSPPSTIGPDGILRLDQLLLPTLIVIILTFHKGSLELQIDNTIKYLSITVGTVYLSVVIGLIWFGYPTGINDFFEIIIWSVYLGSLIIIPTAVWRSTARNSVKLILIFSILASFFVIFQSINLFGLNQYVSPLFTYQRHLDVLGRRATGPTLSSNVIPQLLLLPFLVSFSLVLRELTVEDKNITQRSISMSVASLIIFIGIYLSYSRSGLVFMLSSILVVITSVVIIDRSKMIRVVQFATLSFIPLIILISIFGLGRHDVFSNITEAHTLQSRLQIWKDTAPLVLESPIIGQGTSDTRLNEIGYTTHDSGILNFWYRYGLVGLLSFVFFILSVARIAGSVVFSIDSKKYHPIEWATGCAIFGWSIAMFVPWIFVNVAQARRSFTLYIFFVILLYSISIHKSDHN